MGGRERRRERERGPGLLLSVVGSGGALSFFSLSLPLSLSLSALNQKTMDALKSLFFRAPQLTWQDHVRRGEGWNA